MLQSMGSQRVRHDLATEQQQWTAAHQAPLSMGFPRQEYWGGLPFLPPENLSDPGIELVSALADRFFTTGAT